MNNEPIKFADEGQEITCCVCGKVERYSSLAAQTQWRAIEVDKVRHYACPAEFPADGASSGQFELAYKRVLKVIIEKAKPEVTTPHPTLSPSEAERVLQPVRRCRKCGCTDERACLNGGRSCHWVLPDLCSACVPQKLNERDIRQLEKVDLGVRLNGPEGFAVLTALQLALNHVSYPPGPSRDVVLAVAMLIAEKISVTENIGAMAAAGFVPNETLLES